jgi:hypothetical protein
MENQSGNDQKKAMLRYDFVNLMETTDEQNRAIIRYGNLAGYIEAMKRPFEFMPSEMDPPFWINDFNVCSQVRNILTNGMGVPNEWIERKAREVARGLIERTLTEKEFDLFFKGRGQISSEYYDQSQAIAKKINSIYKKSIAPKSSQSESPLPNSKKTVKGAKKK